MGRIRDRVKASVKVTSRVRVRVRVRVKDKLSVRVGKLMKLDRSSHWCTITLRKLTEYPMEELKVDGWCLGCTKS